MPGLQALVRRRASTLAAPSPGGTVAVAPAAPHLRDGFSLECAMRCVMVALIPCVFMAFYNTGCQANAEAAIAGLAAAPG